MLFALPFAFPLAFVPTLEFALAFELTPLFVLTATFEFELAKPGTFAVEVLQGCGKGSGGSEVEVSAGESKLTFTVKYTGGFQNFEAREVGTLAIDKPGRHTLTVKPLKKPGLAVMDLRQVVLRPAKP